MIDIRENNGICSITINEDWNWVVSKKLEQIDPQFNQMCISLSHCRLMDSESLILLFKWISEGKQIELIDTPDIFFEMIDILDLNEALSKINHSYS